MSDYELINSLMKIIKNAEVDSQTEDIIKDFLNDSEKKELKEFLTKMISILN